ncbi:hypothetical protein CBR_g25819 [Chara braunii]|uniref:Uncharacterized protein n=1 Tax=Chara braunii TaxID=69332 RepID=A0A388L6G5_CHABU|nr:hypothetical protein CBR_g25819 [Chara braunii]|eukprot:GBG77887.1 hypothetical protein CBR_g25819 [Chara braunii]
MAAAPIANGPGRVGALMEEVDGGGSSLATTEEAAELIPLDQYVSIGYPGLGMIGTIRPAPEQKEVAEWRPSPGEMESGGPTFVTGEIDVLNIVRALDHRILLPIGDLLLISKQANERHHRDTVGDSLRHLWDVVHLGWGSADSVDRSPGSVRRHHRAGARHGPPASLVSKLANGRAPGASSLRAAPMSHRRVSYFGLPSSIPTLWEFARAPTLSYHVKENSAPLLSEEKRNAWWEDYIELALCLLEIEFRWSEAAPFGEGPEHPEDSVELLIIQAWRMTEQGDLLGIVFGKVEEGNLALITNELLVFLTLLVDDLPLDILSHSDKQPGTHVLSRTLEPHLVWSTCTEIDEDNCLYSSQALYVEIDVTDLTFWDPIARQNAAHDEEIGGEDKEEEEEEPSSEERDDPDYVPEIEAGIADESS